ncbi:MAG: hypothetical protein WBE60_03190 [Nitrosotalea sp.]
MTQGIISTARIESLILIIDSKIFFCGSEIPLTNLPMIPTEMKI